MSIVSDRDIADAVAYHIQQLILTPPHAGKNKIHTDKLVELFTSITGISAHFNMNEWQDADLQSGVAISPIQAARCLQETVRTQVFLKGVVDAINNKQRQHGSVNILYAGTGPYGLLILPILRILNNPKISVTLLDIHRDNITSVEKVIHTLDIQENIKQIEQADATCWHPLMEESYDLIVSETMNNLLRREPQLAIFSHLQQFLKEDGELIPQRITTGAKIIASGSQKGLTEEETHPPIDLGTFFVCDKEVTNSIHNGDMTPLTGEIALPNKINRSKYNSLKFTTTIDVYGNHQLKEGNCSLNIPIYYHRLKLQDAGHISFEYQLNNDPKFIFDIPQAKLPRQLPAINEVGSLKIAHIKRFWHKTQLSRDDQPDKQMLQSEWSLDLRLMELLELPMDKTLCFLYQEQPEFSDFEQWLREEVTETKLSAPHQINEALLSNVAI